MAYTKHDGVYIRNVTTLIMKNPHRPDSQTGLTPTQRTHNKCQEQYQRSETKQSTTANRRSQQQHTHTIDSNKPGRRVCIGNTPYCRLRLILHGNAGRC